MGFLGPELLIRLPDCQGFLAQPQKAFVTALQCFYRQVRLQLFIAAAQEDSHK